MELGLVRSAIAGVTQPTPPAPEPVQTAIKPELKRARAVEALAKIAPPAAQLSTAVPLNTLPLTVEPSAAFSAEAENALPSNPGNSGREEQKTYRAPADPLMERRFERDDETKQLVFRLIEVESGEVVQQIPQENRLRLREILRAFGEIPPQGRTALFDGSY